MVNADLRVTALYITRNTDMAQLASEALDAMVTSDRLNVFRTIDGGATLAFTARRLARGFHVIGEDGHRVSRCDTAEDAVALGMRMVRR